MKVINRQDYCDLSREQIFDVCAVHLLDENILVVGVYHSNLTSHFEYLELFERLLCKVTDEGLECVIMGDANINLLERSSAQRQLVDLLACYNFTQLVEHPTRVEVGGSSTLLDHVYTNIPASRVAAVAGIDTRPLSDHIAQRLILSRSIAPVPTHRLSRSFTTVNKNNFVHALESIDWGYVIEKSNQCYNALADSLLAILTYKYNICFPVKKHPVLGNKHWVDEEIHNYRHLLHEVSYLKNKYPHMEPLHNKYAELSLKYHSLLKEKRTRFYSSKIQDNPRCMWHVINTELGRSNRERADFTDLIRNTDGQPFKTKINLVDALNLEFVTAASRCHAPTADKARALAVLASGSTVSHSSIRLVPFSAFEVLTLATKRIAPKKSTDRYGLSAELIKTAIKPLAPVMTHLFNLSMRKGAYPSALKKVKISPLYKGKGKKADAKCYRPISLVPAVSKIFEVGLNNRLLNFILDRDILSNRQYAYRAGRGTTDLVREVVWKVVSAREAGQQVALVCCDLSRAFDTADHALITGKLGHYGVSGPAGSLLTDFMSGRTQAVVGDKGRVVSSELEIAMGVPQGSCLSNTMFSLLLNDLPGAVENAEIYMYADDVAAVVTAPTSAQLQCELNSVVQKLDEWFRSNGLALNKEKTCFMTFNLNGKSPKQYSVAVGGAALQQVQCTKLLGFHIDGALSWETHIDELCGKLSRSCFALRRLASTATRDVVRSCYFATVHSNITYGLELWGRAADYYRVFVMQKRALRAMYGASDDVSCVDFFKELQIPPLPCEVIYQLALFTHNNLHLFQRKGVNQTRNLRSNKRKDQLVTPSHRLVRSERSVYIAGPAVYNRLPAHVRDAPSSSSFKIRLKTWLLEQLFYDNNAFMKLPEICSNY